jgi:hypothetical protein
MPQLHFYVSDTVAKDLRAHARALGLSLSRYLATVVHRDQGKGWPAGYFDHVAGRWQGKALRRPPQIGFEEREAL